MDPLDMFDAIDREQAKRFAALLRCDCCRAAIEDDYLYDIGHELLCEQCMRDKYRRDVDDYVRDIE